MDIKWVCPILKTILEVDNRERDYLVHSSYFWNIEYWIGTVLVIIGSDFSLKEKEKNITSPLQQSYIGHMLSNVMGILTS